MLKSSKDKPFLLNLHIVKKTIGHILLYLLLFFRLHCVQAQEVSAVLLDERLERYELLCGMCMELKTRIAEGENVSKTEAQAFIRRFLDTNRELKACEVQMTAVQRRRFAAVGRWFSTGELPTYQAPEIPEVAPVPYGCLMSSLPSSIASPSADALQVPPSPSPPGPEGIYLLAGMSVPDLSYGLMAGYLHRSLGFFASFRSNFISKDASYSCTSNYSLPDGSAFWASGGRTYGNLFSAAGMLVRASGNFVVYAGAGYGYRKLYWEDIDGEWACVSDWSHSGIAVETGGIFRWRQLAVSAGISTTAFRSCSFTCGVGVCF